MQNLLKQSPLSIRNVLGFLASSDIIKLEAVHPKFRLLNDLELYQKAITECFFLKTDSALDEWLMNPYRHSNVAHTRADFLKLLELKENQYHDLIDNKNRILPTLIWNFQLLDSKESNVASNPEYFSIDPEFQAKKVPVALHLVNCLQIKCTSNQMNIIFHAPWTLIIKIQLLFIDRENLIRYLKNIVCVELVIGSQVINRQDRFDLELFWRSHSSESNVLTLFGQNISHNQPMSNWFHRWHELEINIGYNQLPEFQPKLQIIGTDYFAPSVPACDRLILINQSTPVECYIKSLTTRISLNCFQHSITAIYLIVKDVHTSSTAENIKLISLIFNNIMITSFKPETLLQIIPKKIGLSPITDQKYYLISFNQKNPFIYDLEAFKQSINFSRLYCIELQIDFINPFTGTLKIKADSLNLATMTGAFYGFRFC